MNISTSYSRKKRQLEILLKVEFKIPNTKIAKVRCLGLSGQYTHPLEWGRLTIDRSNGEEVIYASVKSLLRRLDIFVLDEFHTIITEGAHCTVVDTYWAIIALLKNRGLEKLVLSRCPFSAMMRKTHPD